MEGQAVMPSGAMDPVAAETEEPERQRKVSTASGGKSSKSLPVGGTPLDTGGELNVESLQILKQEQEVNLETSKGQPIGPASTWDMGSSIVGVGDMLNWDSWRHHYKWKPLHFTHLPGWMRDNTYIHRHYRPQLKSYTLCFLSIFRTHYDSVNIWTHIVGIFMLIGMMTWCLYNLRAAALDRGILSVFFCTGIICFFNSASFHIFWVRSPKVSRLLNRLDYVSIVVLIIGSFVSWLYYLLYCYLILQIIYLSILAVLGTSAFVLFTFERFTRPKYRWFRAAAFIGLGLSGLVPIIHSLYLSGLYVAYYKLSLGYLLLVAAIYIAGATIYGYRIPEKWWPGKFDIFFQSHQFLHLATLIAVCFYTRGIWLMMNYQINETTCLPSYWG